MRQYLMPKNRNFHHEMEASHFALTMSDVFFILINQCL